MIKIIPKKNIDEILLMFDQELTKNGFLGSVELGYDQRYTLATDNSIYQIIPQTILYPKNINDISIAVKLLNTAKFSSLTITPRGGGTGTNGQSLTNGILLDTSRYMTKIIEINTNENWAKVEAGVIKDNLNDQIVNHGLFFAPELSTSDRATIGGMVSTDASGQGSLIYGKTNDHVLEITSVLSDGSIHISKAISKKQLQELTEQQGNIAKIYSTLDKIYQEKKQQINLFYPQVKRSVSGYNLKKIYDTKKCFNLNSVLCGSEGTLAIISEIKIKLTPIPKHNILIVACYDNFISALRDTDYLLTFKPTAIETIDDKVLNLAKSHSIWEQIKDVLVGIDQNTNAMHFIEFSGDVAKKLIDNPNITEVLGDIKTTKMTNCKLILDKQQMQIIFNMRKLAVGLLGRMTGDARPIAFVEDTIVPPDSLADFISDFIAILQEHNLKYGMFGHSDAGVMHVRPAIDMKQPKQRQLIRTISNKVALLVKKYNGVLWGEHGKGIRSEYNKFYYGELNDCLKQIKTAFDPNNKFNPGKLAIANNSTVDLIRIDEAPTRGEADNDIPAKLFAEFSEALYCNGNGACFNYDHDKLMCPTFKMTQNRIHSPKGRSGLIKEWLRQQSLLNVNIQQLIQQIRYQGKSFFLSKVVFFLKNLITNNNDFNHNVYQALDSCIGCKSCSGQCPIKVNIPDVKARFFELYHSRYFRPIKHSLAANLDIILPKITFLKPIYNTIISNKFVNGIMAKFIGLRDIPKISSTSPQKDLLALGAKLADIEHLKKLSDNQRDKTVILIQDPYTSFFDLEVVKSHIKLLIAIGYNPIIAPYFPVGKAMHVFGFLNKFNKLVAANANYLANLANCNVPMLGIEPAITLLYRDEYKKIAKQTPKVLLLSEWLVTKIAEIMQLKFNLNGSFTLLSHCTELSQHPGTTIQWQKIFNAFGLILKHQPTGCCGMAGLYGHEQDHYQESQKLFNLSWHKVISENQQQFVATGFSCRSQVKRLAKKQLLHPVEAIVNKILASKL